MDPSLLIILLFILAPLIEKILKAGKPPQEPPDQKPRQRPAPGQRAQPPVGQAPRGPASRPTHDEDEDLAAGMLPDDLWEILTGERRPPVEPQRAPQPRRVPQQRTQPQPTSHEYDTVDGPPASFEDRIEHSFEVEGEVDFESDFDPDFEEAAYSAEPVEIEPYVHQPPVREAPKVVSLEKTYFDAESRHNRFHERLEELPPAAAVRSRRPTRASGLLDNDDLRQAIIMNEVLGPPRGLQ